ncbi:MAG: hypothetical protein ACR2KT_07580 [Methylocella sp.]
MGSLPIRVAFTRDNIYAYVTNAGSNNVSVIDEPSKTVVATVPVGTSPFGVRHYAMNHDAGRNLTLRSLANRQAMILKKVAEFLDRILRENKQMKARSDSIRSDRGLSIQLLAQRPQP